MFPPSFIILAGNPFSRGSSYCRDLILFLFFLQILVLVPRIFLVLLASVRFFTRLAGLSLSLGLLFLSVLHSISFQSTKTILLICLPCSRSSHYLRFWCNEFLPLGRNFFIFVFFALGIHFLPFTALHLTFFYSCPNYFLTFLHDFISILRASLHSLPNQFFSFFFHLHFSPNFLVRFQFIWQETIKFYKLLFYTKLIKKLWH